MKPPFAQPEKSRVANKAKPIANPTRAPSKPLSDTREERPILIRRQPAAPPVVPENK
jgi:hypothetical protein